MIIRWIVREPWQNTITPHTQMGLFCGRRSARVAAKDHGYPPQLIKKVSRHENEDA